MRREELETLNETAALCLSITGAMREKWFSELFLNQERRDRLYLGRILPEELLGEDIQSLSWYDEWKKGRNRVFPLPAFWDREEVKKLILSAPGEEKEVERFLNRFYDIPGEDTGKIGWRYVEKEALGVPIPGLKINYSKYFTYIDVQSSGKFFIGVGKGGEGDNSDNLLSSNHLYVKGDLSKTNPQVQVGIHGLNFHLSEKEGRTIYRLFLASYLYPGENDRVAEEFDNELFEVRMMHIGLSSIISSSIKTLTQSATPASWSKVLVVLSKANHLLYKL